MYKAEYKRRAKGEGPREKGKTTTKAKLSNNLHFPGENTNHFSCHRSNSFLSCRDCTILVIDLQIDKKFKQRFLYKTASYYITIFQTSWIERARVRDKVIKALKS